MDDESWSDSKIIKLAARDTLCFVSIYILSCLLWYSNNRVCLLFTAGFWFYFLIQYRSLSTWDKEKIKRKSLKTLNQINKKEITSSCLSSEHYVDCYKTLRSSIKTTNEMNSLRNDKTNKGWMHNIIDCAFSMVTTLPKW